MRSGVFVCKGQPLSLPSFLPHLKKKIFYYLPENASVLPSLGQTVPKQLKFLIGYSSSGSWGY